MSTSLRIAVFTGAFPVISETFIVRQIVGLLADGHEVDIYADCRSADAKVQPAVARQRLLERVTWMDMPPETSPWEMPVWPIRGRTWPPGAETPVPNSLRLARALPALASCAIRQPRLLRKVLNASQYGYQAQSLSALYRLHKLCSVRKRYHVLHAHFGPVAKTFRFARELWQTPLVVSFHGYDFSTVPRKEGPAVYEKLFASVDCVTINSDYSRVQVEKLGCPPGRIHKLPVGLFLNDFPFSVRRLVSGETTRIITVGRLVEIKGHEFVLRALALLRRRGLAVHYDIVGDGPLLLKLQTLAHELELSEAVFFHGALDTAEVNGLLARAHLFVLTSVTVDGDREGQGLVVQEAQASGLPVVVTDHGALPEGMLPGVSGFVVPERDIEALATQLSFLVSHPELWPELGRQGRKFIEDNYDMSQLNRRLINLYHEAVKSFDR